VHNRFPGFLTDPADVFEALWERRTTVPIAHRDIPCPDVPANAGGSIWRAIDAERDEDAIVVHVGERHEVNPDEIGEQVLAFLTDLAQRHLIVRT
jgi:hypothetical protein